MNKVFIYRGVGNLVPGANEGPPFLNLIFVALFKQDFSPMSHAMLPEEIDRIFPYIVFVYGCLLTIALNVESLERLSAQYIPAHFRTQMKMHRGLGLVCLWVGGLWILQNLWLIN